MLNIHFKLITIYSALILLLAIQACVADEKPETFDAEQDAECIAAKNGLLDVSANSSKSKTENTPRRNSFLFDCAVDVTIAGPKDTKVFRQELQVKKQQIADDLLSKKIDAAYVNAYGNTTLQSVVMSFLSDDWKLKTARKLIELGVDVKHINSFNKTALDLAKQKNSDNLVQLLSTQH